ncbi:helicase-associated domain-containing protein [Rhizohabitans arisaemae]|uniref:helicase-associated domain-containing protein n=1 Tax=Rhizohabitans arisaemae TaxID=2720610 RepID=UPI0024B1C85F|nr:helicase-associated domain-containing protein [Rhizohabitans arisaemae]
METDFATWLRGRTDDDLCALVAARPELITPVPTHLNALAARAASRSALDRALDRLDAFSIAVLEALLVLPSPLSRTDLAASLRTGGEPVGDALDAALGRLGTWALVYSEDDALRPAPGLHQALPRPAGLGPPAEEAFAHYPRERRETILADVGHDDLVGMLQDPLGVARLVADVGPAAREALDNLAWGPPLGTIRNAMRPVRIATASSPIEALLARGLIAAVDDDTVVLPREVGLWLRGGRIHRTLPARPPAVDGRRREAELIDRTAAGQAFTAVRAVEELCELWGADPPGVLRTGGLGVRDLRRTAVLLDVPDWAAGLWIELAYAAGLIAASGTVDGEWLPTPGYDSWSVRTVAERWAVLAATWLTTERVPALIGERDDRDRPVYALHPALQRTVAPATRAVALRALAAADHGVVPTAESLHERISWEHPRHRDPRRDQMIEFTLREAEQLGVTGLGGLSGHGRALLAESDAAAVLAPLLPEPVEHVLLQADLTAVAPGPLTTELGRALALAADVESTGGATVYRFGEESVRRALDAGQSASDLLSMLEKHSSTPVPQPLRYLVEDVSRRHGQVRVGGASAYIRCDDPVILDQLIADRRSPVLRLRRLAPTVIASRSSRDVLVDALRSMGYAPVAESLDGDLLVSRLESRRGEPVPPPGATRPAPPGPELVAAAVRALRAGDEAEHAIRRPIPAPTGGLPRSAAAEALAALQAAISSGLRVWIGYLDAQGQATSRILEPARLEGGFLTAYDATRAAVHRFALHRITGVAEVDEGEPRD